MTTLTGKFVYEDNTPVANGILVLTLSQPCIISGTGQIVPLVKVIQLDASGNIPAAVTVYGNDALTPAGTTYTACLYTGVLDNATGLYNTGAQLFSLAWSITGASVDVSTLTPTTNGASYVSPVTSIGLTMPGEFSVSGSPVTSAGTFVVSKVVQSANQIYAGPSTGSPAAPGFRRMVAADVPLLAATSIPAATAAALGGVHLPSITVLTSGSGTYNVPAGAIMLRVRLVGGGAGGTGGGVSLANLGGSGGNTTFGTLTANGGAGSNGGNGGTGGTATGGDVNVTGNCGQSGGAEYGNAFTAAGTGAPGPWGGSGQGGYDGAGNAGTGPGAGGGGGGVSASTGGLFLGPGGGGGGYVEKWIIGPSASYAYSVGGAGTAGTAAASGFAGGAGFAGIIIVEAY